MFALRLFSEGGDFSSVEVKFFNECLQKESKQIDSFESSIKTDVEGIKSSCLEQVCKIKLLQMMFPIDIFDGICSQIRTVSLFCLAIKKNIEMASSII